MTSTVDQLAGGLLAAFAAGYLGLPPPLVPDDQPAPDGESGGGHEGGQHVRGHGEEPI